MRLYVGPTSPFSRLAAVVARELSVDVSIECINVYEAEFLDQLNPLRQIPTLVLNDGKAIYDSRVICHYFDRLTNADNLWNDDDYAMMTRLSLALGIMETGLARYMESLKADGIKCISTLHKYESRIHKAITKLEEDREFNFARPLAIDQLAVACALEYTDFRYNTEWRKFSPRLSDWLDIISERESLVISRPVLT